MDPGAQERRAALERLRGLSEAAPKATGSWSYQRVLDFKDAVKQAKKALSPKATMPTIYGAINRLEAFHKEGP